MWGPGTVPLGLLAIVLIWIKHHKVCKEQARVYRNKVYYRDLHRDKGRHIHHLRTLEKDSGLVELEGGMPGKRFLSLFNKCPFTWRWQHNQVVMHIKTSVSCDVWLRKVYFTYLLHKYCLQWNKIKNLLLYYSFSKVYLTLSQIYSSLKNMLFTTWINLGIHERIMCS